jgi:DNA repair protein RecN (Recombination protein N)
MLKKLSIENYALIRKLDLRFARGFSTLTGETGAGKSIMLGALGLVLGNRADSQVLWNKAEKCIVEATFQISGYQFEAFFLQYDLDFDDETILRREITPAGKTRAFVNDTPVNLQVLRDLGSKLINIHSQHEILVLNDREFQLAMLDSFAGHEDKVTYYQERYHEYQKTVSEIRLLQRTYAEQLAQFDYNQFLFDELKAASLDHAGMEAIEEECNLLENAEEIKSTLFQLASLFSGEEIDFLVSLKSLANNLEKLTIGKSSGLLLERLNALYIEAEDLSRDIDRFNEGIIADPERLEQLRERLGHLNHLLQKHHAGTIEDLIRIREELDMKLRLYADTSDAIRVAEAQLEVIRKDVTTLAGELSQSRKAAIRALVSHLLGLLAQLGMPEADIRIDLEPLQEPGPDGLDRVTLRFSANKGIAPETISKIASGGELSRLMLAVKSVLSTRNLIPTIIFDEIDSGVSGEIAGKAGNLMKLMGESMQVIAITHLPQIAAKGASQYLALKSNDQGRTISHVIELSLQERVDAIARMLSDAETTEESIANARRLLGQPVVEQ